MHRVPGFAWRLTLVCVIGAGLCLALLVMLAPGAGDQVVDSVRRGISTDPASVNPRILAGSGALVISALLLLLFISRRQLYILFWIGGWLLLSGSMFVAARPFAAEQTAWLAYGLSQFIAILSALSFGVAADAYTARPRFRRVHVCVLVPAFFWFTLATTWLGPQAAFGPGHVLVAGGLTAAALAHLLLLRRVRTLGAVLIGVSLLAVAGSHVWLVLRVPALDAGQIAGALLFSLVPYLAAALGMQLMTFEDMTWELRRANRRLKAAQGKLRHLVISDPLTGCRNRRFFDEIIGRELQRRRRYGNPLSVLFVDIDRFKTVNDQLGHEAGDSVLQQVSVFLLENIREADYVFRWGGDEFLILLSCAEAEARSRGETLQAEFDRSPPAALLPAGVGLSIGCAQFTDDVDAMSVIRLADQRMYVNKKRGSTTLPGLLDPPVPAR